MASDGPGTSWVVFIAQTFIATWTEKNHRFLSFFIEEENSSSRKMSVFPKISLKLEVENYLKAGFMNKEVGQINILDAVYRHSNIYTRGIGKKNLKGN